MANLYGFNPRTRKGCDLFCRIIFAPECHVSIHAPVKDATRLRQGFRLSLVVSIHAPVKDATFSCHLLHRHIQGFNPRTRKGCNLSVDVSTDKGKVSIHAPVKDATN